ncbi:hypothetical protein IMCC3135_33415 [Granulosicoccus antarcticus IMCC3135]|uniref:Uncharacterized protein n=1 Tax=Granulosicoccus antarcticus IMCC3135 TaxID=1192854 RepID=A0A2Z2P7R9_9GAMM|nr:hypothetical protein IMCC3135_33415 [Granulosicoccus antarcticus IMCC3135]
MALSIAVLLAGVLYYGLYRQHALPPMLEWLSVWMPHDTPLIAHGLLGQSVPSLTHAFATVLLLHALLPATLSTRLWLRLTVVGCLFLFEGALGTPDTADVMAIVLGALMAELLAWRLGLFVYARQRTSRWALAGLVSLSGLLAAGTSPLRDSYGECAAFDVNGECEEYKKPATPIYMSYAELREAVRLESARAPDQLGRVYLYGDYIFLNERNKGIHVIDNGNPEAPLNVGFINIPGNTELAIRDNYLYADSFVDLITLDLNDPANVQLISRQEDIFPYDEFQSIPYNISFRFQTVDRQRGVIVGYRLRDN